MPNFKKLSKIYEKDALVALEQFVRIASVYDSHSKKEGQPYGAKVKEALDYLAKLGTDFGFKVDTVDGYCTEISVGDEGPLVGVYGHSDVVPATGSWTNPPFSATLKDGRLWGRGAADDKGPLIAAFYALKLLKDNGLIKGYRVKLVSGGDEERGSSCLTYYFEEHKGEEPAFGFTPDADYPLIYAEKGIRNYTATRTLDLSPIIAMTGGVVTNAVCDSLLVTLKEDKKFEQYLKDNKIPCDFSPMEGLSVIRFKGVAAHGSTPEKGKSAILSAFKAVGEYYHLDALTLLASSLADPSGKSFDGFNHSNELGDTTYNYGIVNYDSNKKTLSLTIDFRYGENAEPDLLIANLEKASKLACTKLTEAKPLLFDKKSLLVSTLMKVYKQETFKLFDKPLAIGGGTYAKEAKNTVAFGAAFKEHPGNMHSPDEYIYVDDFAKDIAIYAHAIYALGHVSK
ncbi:MAG: Sapep family Mn(2+)-dependent dipeptidase [Bacilli bacterium]